MYIARREGRSTDNPGMAADEPRGAILPLVPYLRAVARDLVRDPGAADALVRDALVRALAEWEEARPAGHLGPWLLGILRERAGGSVEPART